jgi:hypothetical protein
MMGCIAFTTATASEALRSLMLTGLTELEGDWLGLTRGNGPPVRRGAFCDPPREPL